MPIPEPQSEAAAFLQELTGAHPIETHISAVFCGNRHAFKLKKAVMLPYLDFSDPVQRLHSLRMELILNKTTAPEIYQHVKAIYRTPSGKLALTEDGQNLPAQAVDYVLQMARIPENDLFDNIAAQGPVTTELLKALADTVFFFHAGLAPIIKKDWPNELLRLIDGNRIAARYTRLDSKMLTQWYELAVGAVHARWADFAARGEGGFIRRTHGDLHLGNICLWKSKPTLFDALEFDENLATIDTAYDLAFLLMDLNQRLGSATANLVFNRIIARNGDAAMVPLLPLYLSLRAIIRAHVTALSGDLSVTNVLLGSAIKYLQPNPVALIAIGGLPGSGKSTLAYRLAPRFGSSPGGLVLRHDEIRKQLAGFAPERKLDPSFYTPEMNDRVERRSLDLMKASDFSRTIIVDATCRNPLFQQAIEDAARAHKIAFFGFWLTAPSAALEERVGARKADASDADVTLLRSMLAAAQAVPAEWRLIDTTQNDGGFTEMMSVLSTSKLQVN